MYRQARFYIRTALICLVLAFIVGAVLLINQGFGIVPEAAAFTVAFYHLLMVGYATQLIAGVALWMFPPFARGRPHGDERLGWLAYVALNAGLALRVIGEPLNSLKPGPIFVTMMVLSAILQVLAIYLIVALLWPRVRGRITPSPSSSAAQGGN